MIVTAIIACNLLVLALWLESVRHDRNARQCLHDAIEARRAAEQFYLSSAALHASLPGARHAGRPVVRA